MHLECRLEPLNDPTMRVEWFQNGRPVTIGSRFRTYSEFGFVALDVLDLTTADAGEYTVRATNQLGSAHTSAMVRVSRHADVDTETQHDGALEQIQYLESGARMTRQVTTETSIDQVRMLMLAVACCIDAMWSVMYLYTEVWSHGYEN